MMKNYILNAVSLNRRDSKWSLMWCLSRGEGEWCGDWGNVCTAEQSEYGCRCGSRTEWSWDTWDKRKWIISIKSQVGIELNEWLMLMLTVYCARPARDQRFPRLHVIWIFMYPFSFSFSHVCLNTTRLPSLCIFSIPDDWWCVFTSVRGFDYYKFHFYIKRMEKAYIKQQQHPKKQKSHKQMNNAHDEVIKRCGPPAISCSLIIITLTTSCLAGLVDLIFHSSTANSAVDSDRVDGIVFCD